jgi:hypothetical protein
MTLASAALLLADLACLAILVSPFRKCALIAPVLLTGAFAGYVSNMMLWGATGGKLSHLPDLLIPTHAPAPVPAAFTPLWTVAIVVIVGTVIGLSLIIIRQSIRDNAQYLARLRMNAR